MMEFSVSPEPTACLAELDAFQFGDMGPRTAAFVR
jgi:hypothetical protein